MKYSLVLILLLSSVCILNVCSVVHEKRKAKSSKSSSDMERHGESSGNNVFNRNEKSTGQRRPSGLEETSTIMVGESNNTFGRRMTTLGSVTTVKPELKGQIHPRDNPNINTGECNGEECKVNRIGTGEEYRNIDDNAVLPKSEDIVQSGNHKVGLSSVETTSVVEGCIPAKERNSLESLIRMSYLTTLVWYNLVSDYLRAVKLYGRFLTNGSRDPKHKAGNRRSAPTRASASLPILASCKNVIHPEENSR
ncbi:hypothetical protein WDU94_012040 [Cyamophila willieti]